MKVIIVGAGWAGCAAAFSAKKQGAEVTLIERMDMLLGTGLRGGIMRNNGRFAATEEMIAMGAGELFQLIDQNCLHRNIEFPGQRHVSLYNATTMEPIISRFLNENKITACLFTRIENVEMDGDRMKAVIGKQGGKKVRFEGDAFIDATGTAGPTGNCTKYGKGCAVCIIRCPSFGGRVSITAKAGVKEMVRRKGEKIGTISVSRTLPKESLSDELAGKLNQNGVVVVPIPPSVHSQGKSSDKTDQSAKYARPELAKNLLLLDIGLAKLLTPFIPLDLLRCIPGFENARYEDPYAGVPGHSLRWVGMAPRDGAMKVDGIENLFCAGEKAGLPGHTEAIVTGTLAGHNAVRQVRKEKPLILASSLSVGDIIAFSGTQMKTQQGLENEYSFISGVYFERMKQKGFYSINIKEIKKRVDQAGMLGVFSN